MSRDARLRIIVEGDVQGVGYRAFVKYAARSLKIRGAVRNLPDGTVEILCEGEKDALRTFKDRINQRNEKGGLFSMNVTGMKEHVIEKLPAETATFDVDYGGEAATPFEKTNLERLEIGSLLMADFRDSATGKFDVMEERYGTISRQMETLTKEFVSSNKNNAKLVEVLVKKLDKLIGNGN
jgi:acylphosphatase